MAHEDWRSRLLASTRGRVLELLRRSAQTVNELAQALGLTDNAVRLHLSALERDGLVEVAGTRREWTGKPAVVYRTAAEAEGLFPKPYAAVLDALLVLLREQRGEVEVEALLREAGVRLAAGAEVAGGARRARFVHAAAVLNSLGGLAEVEEDGETGGLRLQGHACPLGALTAAHPEACGLAESLVGALVGEPVREVCERGVRPRCAFVPTG